MASRKNLLLPTKFLPFPIHTPNAHMSQQWDSLIKEFCKTATPQESLMLYTRMRRNGIAPGKHAFPPLFKAISKLRNEKPSQVHAHVVKLGFNHDNFVTNSLISAYSTCGYLEFASRVFDDIEMKDVVSWTAIIDAFVKNGCAVNGLKYFIQMRSMGNVKVDEFTVVSVLSAAGMVGDVLFGKCIHGLYIETGRVKFDVFVGSALVDLYSKCNFLEDARKVFDKMSWKNVVSWSSLIAGYVQCDRYRDALMIFEDMMVNRIEPNQHTFTSVLTACAQLGSLDQGRWVHRYIDRSSIEITSTIGTALIDMYAKCGCINEALLVFEKLRDKEVYPWTAMISGLAMNGDALGALNLFSKMLRSRVQPNEVTFIAVLSACAHGGLVDEGRMFFESMKSEYRLEPNVNHFGCMVDLFGRAGLLEEAKTMIENMPMEPTPGVWGALFGACMIHKDYEMGEYVGKCLIDLQPNHSGRYALLANLYSMRREWDSAARMRKCMKGKGVEKTPGCSWLEVNGVVHEFVAFDECHRRSCELYEMLDSGILSGCVLETNFFAYHLDGV